MGDVAVIVKLVPAVRAVTPYNAGSVTLQVTPSRVPRLESYCRKISLFAVTAVVSTTTVVAAAATTTVPAAAAAQTAGDAEELQFVAVVIVALEMVRFPVAVLMASGADAVTTGVPELVPRVKTGFPAAV